MQEQIGPLLARLRRERGWSQPRVAELLNAASGNPTMTKTEVGRWERGKRLPTRFWLGWLAVVFGVPLAVLEESARVARPAAGHKALPTIWGPEATDALQDFLRETHGKLSRDTALRLADEWRTVDPPQVVEVRAGRRVGARLADAIQERTDELRRMDDYLAGGDMHDLVSRELHATVDLVKGASYPATTGRRLLVAVGDLCQLAGWVASDAGLHAKAERAYLGGVRAAHAAADAGLAANLLSSLSYQVANVGDRREAVLLAGAAYRGAKDAAPGKVRALILERVAWANARFGDGPATDRALGMADDAYADSSPTEGPDWVYWLDRDEMDVMAGRCYTELHRPTLAEPLLSSVVARYDENHLRETALYLSWLAEAHLYGGDTDTAAEVATRVVELSTTVTSARTSERVQHLARLLKPHRQSRAVRRFLQLVPVASQPAAAVGGPLRYQPT